MEDEVLFWSRLNTAVAGFCHEAVIDEDPLPSLVGAVVGDDLEWCGPLAMSFVTRKMIETQAQCVELGTRCKFLENSLSNELVVVANLRNKLKQTQSQSTDNEWRLQEQLAQMNSLLIKERTQVQKLEKQLTDNTNLNGDSKVSTGSFIVLDEFPNSEVNYSGIVPSFSKDMRQKEGRGTDLGGKENNGFRRKSLGRIDPNSIRQLAIDL